MLKTLRKLPVIALAEALAVIAAHAGLTATAQAKALKIGIVTDQSGGLKEYGLEYTQGFTLGLKYATNGSMTAGGRPVQVVIRDDASKPDTGASQARDLIEKEGVEILAGSPSSGVALQLQKTVSDYNMILMAGPSSSASITGANFTPNTLRACRNGAQDFIALASVLQSSGVKKIFVLAAPYYFEQAGAQSAHDAYHPRS